MLFANVPDRDFPAIAVPNYYPKDPFRKEDAFRVVAETTMSKVGDHCLRLIKPLVNVQVVFGQPTELPGTVFRMF
jgi:hypothetical protein